MNPYGDDETGVVAHADAVGIDGLPAGHAPASVRQGSRCTDVIDQVVPLEVAGLHDVDVREAHHPRAFERRGECIPNGFGAVPPGSVAVLVEVTGKHDRHLAGERWQFDGQPVDLSAVLLPQS